MWTFRANRSYKGHAYSLHDEVVGENAFRARVKLLPDGEEFTAADADYDQAVERAEAALKERVDKL